MPVMQGGQLMAGGMIVQSDVPVHVIAPAELTNLLTRLQQMQPAMTQPMAPVRPQGPSPVHGDRGSVPPSPGRRLVERVHLRRHLAEDAILRGKPNGEEACGNCLFYLNPDDDLAYCWHPKLRILVGGTWWCQWWEKIPEE